VLPSKASSRQEDVSLLMRRNQERRLVGVRKMAALSAGVHVESLPLDSQFGKVAKDSPRDPLVKLLRAKVFKIP
jgi:hypothetical protein